MHRSSQSGRRDMKSAIASPELTPREAEVLFWISRGKSNYEIGVILGAKTGTICKHVGHILSKLNVENRTSAAVVALETYGSAGRMSRRKFAPPWATVTGLIVGQLGELWSGGCEILEAISPLIA